MKKYAEEFDTKDRLAHSKLSKEIIAKRQQQVLEYKTVLEQNRKVWEENREKRLQLRGLTEDLQPELVDEEYEFFIREENLPVD